MGRKKNKKANKKKKQKKDNERNSNDLKSISKKPSVYNTISPCTSDLKRFLTVDSNDSVSTTSSQDTDYLDDENIIGQEYYSKEYNLDPALTSKLLADNKINFSFQYEATESRSTAASNQEGKVAEQVFFLNSGEANSWKVVTVTSTEDTQCESPSTGDKVGSLKNDAIASLSQDTVESCKSTVVINVKNKLEPGPLNDIDSICKHLSDLSISIEDLDKADLQSPIGPPNNSTGKVIKSKNRPIFKDNNGLKCSTLGAINGSNFSTSKPADIKVLSSTNSSPKKISSFHSETAKVDSSDKSSFISRKCEDVLLLLISRNLSLHARMIGGYQWNSEMGYWCRNTRIYLTTEVKNQFFRKFKRNACIRSIFEKKIKEFVECSLVFIHLVKEILKFYQENCEIQLRKIAEVFKTFEECVSNPDNCSCDEYTIFNKKTFALQTFAKLQQLDVIGERQLNEKLSRMIKCVTQIESLIETLSVNNKF